MKFHVEIQGEIFESVPDSLTAGDAYVTIKDGSLAIEQVTDVSELEGDFVSLIYLSSEKVKYLLGGSE